VDGYFVTKEKVLTIVPVLQSASFFDAGISSAITSGRPPWA